MKSTSRFILVCIFILVLLAGLFLSPDSVLAAVVRQATMTATNTTVPTPTSQFGQVCPVGTPIGWGTFTPSALWNLTCSSCLTPTAYPTNTIFPTATGTIYPTATGTIYPTATATPLFTATISCGDTVGCIQIDDNTIDLHSSGVSSMDGSELTGDYNSYTFYLSEPSNIYGYLVVDDDYQVWHAGQTWDGTLDLSHHFDNIFYTIPSRTEGFCEGCAARVANQGEYYFTYEETEIIANIHISYHDYPSLWNAYRFTPAHLYVSVNPAFEIGPTPTPTVSGTPYVDDSYCGSINDLPSFGWDLIIEDGPPNCDFGWDEFTVGTYTVPAVQICLQPVQVGVITLFGTVFEMGVFFLAAGAAFFWRFFRTV